MRGAAVVSGAAAPFPEAWGECAEAEATKSLYLARPHGHRPRGRQRWACGELAIVARWCEQIDRHSGAVEPGRRQPGEVDCDALRRAGVEDEQAGIASGPESIVLEVDEGTAVPLQGRAATVHRVRAVAGVRDGQLGAQRESIQGAVAPKRPERRALPFNERIIRHIPPRPRLTV